VCRGHLALIALLLAAPALAQELVGCDKFNWPLERERTMLANPTVVVSGSDVRQPLAAAMLVTLVPFADADLPLAPERTPKSPDSYAGFVRISALPKPGTYRITLSQGAWIDVIQDGAAVKATAHSGASGCDGVRKSVKFELGGGPIIIELSGTTAHAVALVVTRIENAPGSRAALFFVGRAGPAMMSLTRAAMD